MAAQTLTAWEVWDAEHDRLTQIENDTECEWNDADAEVRGYDETIAEMEAELAKLRKKRDAMAKGRDEAGHFLDQIRIIVADHAKAEPEQD
jgi:hypothetical protein